VVSGKTFPLMKRFLRWLQATKTYHSIKTAQAGHCSGYSLEMPMY